MGALTLVLVTVTPEFERPLFDTAVPLTSFVMEAGMVGVRVISGLALVKSMAVSATLLSDKSSALLKSEAATLDLVVLVLEILACERATPPLESCRLSKSAANSRLTAASSLGAEAIAEVIDEDEEEACCCLLWSTTPTLLLMFLLNRSKASIC